MVQNTVFKIIILIWLGFCAWQDWRTGEVSNWLTIPSMLAAGIFALFMGRESVIIYFAAMLAVFVLFYLGSLGGADAKILITLAGLWPLAFVAAILVQGVWGLIVLIHKGRTAGFRAVPSYAAGVLFCLLMGFVWKGG